MAYGYADRCIYAKQYMTSNIMSINAEPPGHAVVDTPHAAFIQPKVQTRPSLACAADRLIARLLNDIIPLAIRHASRA